ncbi:MAG: hypothetical protein Q9218_007556 [Villophora microphyllina]
MDSVYEPIPSAKRPDTSYHPVLNDSPALSEKTASYPASPRQHRRSRVVLHWLWHFLSLLWIGPIIVLLYLNFSKHVIGASAWCPRGNCNAEAATDNAVQRAYQLDRQDHDVNGALQFVAKALEVWFVFIATSLIYDIGILFAKKGRGLPVGYLLSHLEFADIRYVFSPLLWTSPVPHRSSAPEKRAKIIKLYIFAIFTALLTILANLMGPATAVLVLPTLQWVQTPHLMDQTFNDTAVMYQPSGDKLFPQCTNAQLLARNYSCTQQVYGPSLDEWAAQGISASRQGKTANVDPILGSSQEAALTFLLNGTSQDLMWVPNRQVLRAMSHDYRKTSGAAAFDASPEFPDRVFNNSLQTFLQRQGPSLGVQFGCYAGNVTDLTLNDDRWIRCYTGWSSPGDPSSNYTKCLRLGIGSNDTKYTSQFYLENKDKKSPDHETGVGVYFADKAMYFNKSTDFGSNIGLCLNNASSANCDWDKVFDTPLPIELRNTSANVGVVSYQIPGENNTDARVYCDHVTYQSFPTYSVDTSRRTNPQNLVQMNYLPQVENATPLVVNPDWFLAAWSVDVETALDGNRQIVKELIRVLPAFWKVWGGNYDGEDVDLYDLYEFELLHLYALGQSLSMVNYYATDPPAHPSPNQKKELEKDKVHHPILHTYATIHVWAYGLSGRTSKLGVTVVILGCACVLARLILGISTGVQERSTVEVLASMFEHRHQGEFEGLEEEGHLAKVRYRIVEDGDGRQKFIPEKRASTWSHATNRG